MNEIHKAIYKVKATLSELEQVLKTSEVSNLK